MGSITNRQPDPAADGAGVPSLPSPDGRYFFSKLPIELRNEIYRFAYATESKEELRVITKSGFGHRENHRKDEEMSHFKPKEFPPPYVTSFMVNREWYGEAVKEFLMVTRLHLKNCYEIHTFKCCANVSSGSFGGLGLYITSLSVPFFEDPYHWHPNLISGCFKALRRLNWCLNWYSAYRLRRAGLDHSANQWTQEDIRSSEHFRPYFDFRGLAEVTLTLEDSFKERMISDKKNLAVSTLNMRLVGQLLNEICTQPKPEQTDSSSTQKALTFHAGSTSTSDDLDPPVVQPLPLEDGDIPKDAHESYHMCMFRNKDLFEWARKKIEQGRKSSAASS